MFFISLVFFSFTKTLIKILIKVGLAFRQPLPVNFERGDKIDRFNQSN